MKEEMEQRKKADVSVQRPRWRVGKYIRLSREDGNAVSESVVNQEKILDDELPGFFPGGDYMVVDTYIDDGTSGTSDLERRSFQRMVGDMERRRINCVVVKNLSRAFRNSANQGRFLEEFIPLYHTRFISLYQPRIDTFLDPEVVHSLEVSITGFLNEQYAYKTSVDVRRTFRNKRARGEFIGAFAPYGYRKDPENKNRLLVDGEAARVVGDIFSWFLAGMSKGGIVRRLNEYGVPNPTAYKNRRGLKYENPHGGENGGLWSLPTVSRILKDPIYMGVMRQGRQKVVSYKVHKRRNLPPEEWDMVENALPAIIPRERFEAAQALQSRTVRAAPGRGEVYPFSGLVRCAGCGRGMSRHSARGVVYYACRTRREQGGCTGRSIRLDRLEGCVLAAIQGQLSRCEGAVLQALESPPDKRPEVSRLESLLEQRERELKKTEKLLDGLYLDWKSGDVSREQYLRVKEALEEKQDRLSAAVRQLRQEGAALVEGERPQQAVLSEDGELQHLERGLLTALVEMICIQEDGSVHIRFRFAAQR